MSVLQYISVVLGIFITELCHLIVTEETCITNVFVNPVANKALTNHVITSRKVTSAENCEIECFLERKCESYNLGPQLENGDHVCELSNSDAIREPLPDIQPVGCFHDSIDRALPDNYANFRAQIIWTNMRMTVYQCARVAYDKGYEYFGVQFYGVCYGGKDGEKSFAKYGKSTNCWEFDKQNGFSVGKDWLNFVYRIE